MLLENIQKVIQKMRCKIILIFAINFLIFLRYKIYETQT